MGRSQDNKSEFLGVNYGTASHYLRRKILHSLLKELGRNICFRCGEQIHNPDQLSIDHKKPWLYESEDLFWDLANVAFSHKSCNKTDRPWLTRPQNPEGMNWCTKCQKHLPNECFGVSRRNKDGLRQTCNECRKQSGWC